MRRRRLVAIAAGAVIGAGLVAVAVLAFPTGTVGRVSSTTLPRLLAAVRECPVNPA